MKQITFLLLVMMCLLSRQASAQLGPPPEGWQLISSSISFTCNYTYEGAPYTSTGAGSHEFVGSFYIQQYDVSGNPGIAPWSDPFALYGNNTKKVDYDVTVTFTGAGQVAWAALNTATYDGDETWKHHPNENILSRHTFFDVQQGSGYVKGPY